MANPFVELCLSHFQLTNSKEKSVCSFFFYILPCKVINLNVIRTIQTKQIWAPGVSIYGCG